MDRRMAHSLNRIFEVESLFKKIRRGEFKQIKLM